MKNHFDSITLQLIFILISDEPRTNNVAEGWHHAFSSMNGVKRPTIYRFIDALKKDEDIARAKIVSRQSEHAAAPQKKKAAEQNDAIKNAVLTYVKKAELAKEMDDDSDEDEDEDEAEAESIEDAGDATNQWSRSKSSREKWLKTPEMVLLLAIANNSRL